MSDLPRVRRIGRLERFVKSAFKLESPEAMMARERDFVLEQVFSLQLLKRMRPAFIKAGNSLTTIDHPQIDSNGGDDAILATEPLIESEGPESKRTYVMRVKKLKAFVGISFFGDIDRRIGPEGYIDGMIANTIAGARDENRPITSRYKKTDPFDNSAPNRWNPPPFELKIDKKTLEENNGKMTIQQATAADYKRAITQSFDNQDPWQRELHKETEKVIKSWVPTTLGELI